MDVLLFKDKISISTANKTHQPSIGTILGSTLVKSLLCLTLLDRATEDITSSCKDINGSTAVNEP